MFVIDTRDVIILSSPSVNKHITLLHKIFFNSTFINEILARIAGETNILR